MPIATDILEKLNLTDPALNSMGYADCRLLVHVSAEGVAYSVFNRADNHFLSLHQLAFDGNNPQQLLQTLEQTPLFSQLFGQVLVCMDERLCTLVPKALFDGKQAEGYMQLFEPLDTESIHHQPVPYTDVVLVHTFQQQVYSRLQQLFAAPVLISTAGVLLQQCLKEHRTRKDDLLFVCLNTHRLDVVALEKGKLVFYNRFNVQAPQDLSYYLLAVADQTGFNPDTVQVLLTGNQTDDYLPAAQKYFNNVDTLRRPRAYHYSPVLDAVPTGAYYPLYSLNACE